MINAVKQLYRQSTNGRHASPKTNVRGTSQVAPDSGTQARRRFCPNDLERSGCPVAIPYAGLAIGLGSTAGRIVHLAAQFLIREIGRLPFPAAYMMIDSASPSSDMDPDHFVSIGTSGVGTLPENGAKQFESHRPQIYEATASHIESLFDIDPQFPLIRSPLDALRINVVAGCGGTSGGCLQPMLEVCRAAASQRGIRFCRINVILVGPKICTRDITRSRTVSREQEMKIYQTFALNYRNVNVEVCQDRRAMSLQVIDQENGAHVYSRTSDFQAMQAQSLFFQWWTVAGIVLDAQSEDQEQLDEKFATLLGDTRHY